jgi:hypothetical protein
MFEPVVQGIIDLINDQVQSALKMRLWNFLHPPRFGSESDAESLDSSNNSNRQGSHYQPIEDYTKAA